MFYSLVVLAHILADFSFQPDFIAKKKQDEKKYLLLHLVIVFIIMFILTFLYVSWKQFFIVISLTIIHGLIDKLKITFLNSSIYIKYNSPLNLEIFLVDQVLHIGSIIIFIFLFQPVQLNFVFYRLSELLPLSNFDVIFDLPELLIIGLAVIVFNFKGSTIIVRSVLERYKSNTGKSGDKGEAIGNLERLLVISFVILGSYSLVGLMFTAKSLIRFKDVSSREEEDFVEYYLIGSFISIFLGVISGMLIKFLGGAIY